MPFVNVDLRTFCKQCKRIPLSTEHLYNPVSFTVVRFGARLCFFESNFITRDLPTYAVRVASNIQDTNALANRVVLPLCSCTADVRKVVKLPTAPRARFLTTLLRPVRSASPPTYGRQFSSRFWDHKAESRTVLLCDFNESP
jgi:hypothetical protein